MDEFWELSWGFDLHENFPAKDANERQEIYMRERKEFEAEVTEGGGKFAEF